MTYIARVHNAHDGLLYLQVKNGGPSKKIKIPSDPELVRSALSTYDARELKFRPAEDVPDNIKNLKVGRTVDFSA